MKKPLLAILLLVNAAYVFCSDTLSLNYQNTPRTFIVHLPTGYTPGQHLPLVINLHGYTSTGGAQELYSQMDQTANTNNFIVCYPDGLNNSWNSGFTLPYNSAPDDVGFISKVIDTLYSLYSINLQRVYACGMSNGGFQSHRLACDLENRIAAIASVTGTISEVAAFNCTLSRKVPVMHIHGTLDPIVSYYGSTGIKSVDATITFWLGKNGCTNNNSVYNYPNTNTADGSTVERTRYTDCADGTEVVLYKIAGGGHTWPGAAIDIAQYGNTNRDFNASQEIWDFFNRYTLSGPTGIGETKMNDESAYSVFPNPTTGKLIVTATSLNHPTLISLIDVTGRTVISVKTTVSQNELDLSGLTSGVYFVKLESLDLATTRIVIKQ